MFEHKFFREKSTVGKYDLEYYISPSTVLYSGYISMNGLKTKVENKTEVEFLQMLHEIKSKHESSNKEFIVESNVNMNFKNETKND